MNYKGIAAGVSERIIALKKARARLQTQYGSRDALENKIQNEGVPPDDHTLYNDLLEWRAVDYELTQLLKVLENM